MSGYGGQPYDQYGQPQGWDPQGQYSPAPDYGYGPPGTPPGGQPTNGAAVGALIANCVLVVFCCGLLAIPGIITSAMAMSRQQTDPESSRTLTLWSWVIFGCNIALSIVLIAVLIIIGAFEDTSTY
ncbi:hypothetical protein DPM19_06705 [Actinomadura craniellae]|uniref:DUF4190 domain-containing protein n=1 Tax=Actinomadura craniellae TaxID=2231787 RepID=A0A365H8N8_9ACTN|nr:hypothetical protein [Actinomadura craniellae]RAY15494.1 hypothetical protein DPM19_06705 [Actinomadura craniellae]